MVRIVKEYDERHAQFLDVAQQLFYDQGYEQTSVQEIIRAVGVAKGTFYHYFDSKVELLDALTTRLMAETSVILQPLVDDPALGAVEKFTEFFRRINNWKIDNRDFLLEAVRVLYQDKNVLLRTKMESEAVALTAPLLAQILQQGMDEGVFHVAYPLEVAEILIAMGQNVSAAFAPLLLNGGMHDEAQRQRTQEQLARKVRVYERTTECLLGAERDSIRLIEPDTLDAWLM